MARLLVLGAGYIGARLGQLALEQGHEVVLADNWFATERAQLDGIGARVETADIREREQVAQLLDEQPDRIYLLAAQASRPLAEREPDYTEQTNVTGVRIVAEEAASRRIPITFSSSLNVYGTALKGHVMPDHPYGPQHDLAHLTKIYGELCLSMYAQRDRIPLAIYRLGIVYGPSPVEHSDPASQTVVDKFRQLVAAGAEPTVEDEERTIGVVHVDDVAAVFLSGRESEGLTVHNVAAETVTVGDIARLATGEDASGSPAFTFWTPFKLDDSLAEYLRP